MGGSCGGMKNTDKMWLEAAADVRARFIGSHDTFSQCGSILRLYLATTETL